MKFVRYREKISGSIKYGSIVDDQIQALKGDPFGEYALNGSTTSMEDVEFLSPIEPTKVVALAANYKGATGVTDEMAEPIVFIKPPTSILGPFDAIVSPFKGARVWGEAELGIVISKRVKNIEPDQAKDAIGGYVCANDVTAENVDGRDHHLVRSKGADTFCPLGPWVDTDFNPADAKVESYQNDQLIRQGNLNNRIWTDEYIVSWLSKWMTLERGDVILTGTPPRVVEKTYLNDGDVYEVKIEGLGALKNTFLSEQKI